MYVKYVLFVFHSQRKSHVPPNRFYWQIWKACSNLIVLKLISRNISLDRKGAVFVQKKCSFIVHAGFGATSGYDDDKFKQFTSNTSQSWKKFDDIGT